MFLLPPSLLRPWIAAALLIGLTIPLSTQLVSAQPVPSPPGFSAPDSTQPIEAYRLPDWSYSIWNMGANGRTSGRRNSFDDGSSFDRTASNFSGNLRLNSDYLHVWESEQRVARIFVAPDLNATWDSRTLDDGTEEEEQDTRQFGTTVRTEARYDRYVSPQTFLFTRSQLDLRYQDEHRDRSSTGSSGPGEFDQQVTDFNWSVGAGIGFGRIRDVTPVVRALRVQERLRAVRPGASLSTSQVQSVARQFAQRPGYGSVYDRPDKAFWGDLFDQIGRQAGDLSAFETYYLSEALSERVGRRLDGWEVRLSPQFVRFYRNEDRSPFGVGSPASSTTEERSALELRASAAWYETVSLDHQVGLTGSVTHNRELEGTDPLQQNWIATTEGSWLWVLADRFQLNSSLRPFYRVASADGRDVSTLAAVAESNLNVFIEDRLALTAGLNVRHTREWRDPSDATTTDTEFALQFGVAYVLSRVLP